ncbi:MAG: GNAT family N-acetyltransferase [Oscillospiraceae bacterium]|nr:GNAT family N-acetyltransferase [Oscillospiraceae bacterium]
MIRRCSQQDENRILAYIGSDYPRCLYLYLDIKRYGIGSDSIDVFLQQKGDTVSAVLLKYYSCLHVFSRDDSFDAAELADFFLGGCFTMLYCATRTAEKIYSAFPDAWKTKADVRNGWVAQILSVDKEARGEAVPAQKNDFDQITRLILADEDIGKSYRHEVLAKQLEERNREGYARNLVIRQDDLVVAHACTNAEVENIAVVAELIVRKEYQKKGFASEIWRDLCHRLLSEGKEVYSFYYSEESRMLHKHIGFIEKCEWTKIVIA